MENEAIRLSLFRKYQARLFLCHENSFNAEFHKYSNLLYKVLLGEYNEENFHKTNSFRTPSLRISSQRKHTKSQMLKSTDRHRTAERGKEKVKAANNRPLGFHIYRATNDNILDLQPIAEERLPNLLLIGKGGKLAPISHHTAHN